jgi:preprotein translocase subunit SecA
VVQDNQVIIVDEFTGRLMFGRRWSEGLHQAIEAKEGVRIQQESRTLATISFQNYFRMYEKLAGMTGTAATEAEEFGKIYGLEVVVVPTNEPVVRKDHPDVVYKTTRAKYTAMVKEIAEKHKKGQPVLVGTTSIEKNEVVHELLRRKEVPHNILNAKNHQKEAMIIADAGKPEAVTIATNIAGRGVDIVLGGAPPEKPKGKTKKEEMEYQKELTKWQKEHNKVVKLGGLHVIGTERHESRRIDNQLRGRSGRQGDPGSSRFYVALDDEIMRLFGGEQVAKMMTFFKLPEDVPLEHSMVSKAIESAQTKVEGFNFDLRKRVVEYDDVMNKQREIIYKRRRRVLELSGDENKKKAQHQLKDKILENLHQEVAQLVNLHAPEGFTQIEYEMLVREFAQILPFDIDSQKRLQNDLEKTEDKDKITTQLTSLVDKAYHAREEQVGPELMREMERFVTLTTIDRLWMDHLDDVDDLREGIGLRGYAQRDPLVEYKQEAFNLFEQLVITIDYEISRRIFRVQVGAPGQQQAPLPTSITLGRQDVAADLAPQPRQSVVGPDQIPTAAGIGQPRSVVKPVISGNKKLGRNDPCWCGSGKKWKKCHYPQLR